MEEQLFIPIGMRKDFNKELTTQEDSQYLYDAHNISVITRDDETTGSIIKVKTPFKVLAFATLRIHV